MFVEDAEERRKNFSRLNENVRKDWDPHDRFHYSTIREIETTLAGAGKRIADSLGSHDSGSAGDACEEVWAQKLREQIPEYNVVTKGVIADKDGNLSPQIDILILKPDYPKNLLSTKLYHSEGVVAAFECKLNLRLAHIKEACIAARKIKSYTDYAKDPIAATPIYYGLIALGNAIEPSTKTLQDAIFDSLLKHDENLSDTLGMLDSVLIADKICFAATPQIFCQDVEDNPFSMELQRTYQIRSADPEFSTPSDSPLGFFLFKLHLDLAKKNKNLSWKKFLFEVFGEYYPHEKTLSCVPLDELVPKKYIENIALDLYSKDQIVFDIIK